MLGNSSSQDQRKNTKHARFRNSFSTKNVFMKQFLDKVRCGGSMFNRRLSYCNKMNYFSLIQLINILSNRCQINYEIL